MNTEMSISQEDTEFIEQSTLEIEGHTFPEKEELVQHVREQTGLDEIAGNLPEGIEVLGYGKHNIAFLLKSPTGEQFVHKVSDEERQIRNEILGANLAYEVDVPAPKIIQSNQYSLTESYVDGVSITRETDASIRKNAQIELAENLDRLHGTSGEGFGNLATDGRGIYEDMIEYIDDKIQIIQNLAETKISPEDKEKWIRRLESGRQETENILIHGDLHYGNWKIDENTGEITGLIDFGSIKSAPRELEFMQMYRCYLLGLDHYPDFELMKKHYEDISGARLDLPLLQTLICARCATLMERGRDPSELLKRIL